MILKVNKLRLNKLRLNNLIQKKIEKLYKSILADEESIYDKRKTIGHSDAILWSQKNILVEIIALNQILKKSRTNCSLAALNKWIVIKIALYQSRRDYYWKLQENFKKPLHERDKANEIQKYLMHKKHAFERIEKEIKNL